MARLRENDIQPGKTYRARHPQTFADGINDRSVVKIEDDYVFYTGPAKFSTRELRRVRMERFLAWVGHEIAPTQYVYVVVETGISEPKLLWATTDKQMARDFCDNIRDRFVHVETIELRGSSREEAHVGNSPTLDPRRRR